MKTRSQKTSKFTAKKLFKPIVEKAFDVIFNLIKFDMLTLLYRRIGILNFENCRVTGENYLLEQYLPGKLRKDPVIFDVGANVGDYSESLGKVFPSAKIYSFEPNPYSYDILSKNLTAYHSKKLNIGLSEVPGKAKIFTDSSDLSSCHASLFKEVIENKKNEIPATEIEVYIDTVDNFCRQEGIDHIDFIKIDTEGNEYKVLKGSSEMLTNGKIQFIQFEFNEMNVVSRVFLKDFYDLLKDFTFYRLSKDRLIPLGPYDPKNEIFQFQNILAARNV
jgi:FkbM family methyltransferase